MNYLEQAKKKVFWLKIRQGTLFTLFIGVANALCIASLTYHEGSLNWVMTGQAFGVALIIGALYCTVLLGLSHPDYEEEARRLRKQNQYFGPSTNENDHD